MDKIEELEERLLGQIGMLNDCSVMATKEDTEMLINRSRCMVDLADNYIELQKTKLEDKRLKIEAVKVMHRASEMFNGKEDKNVMSYLGIESVGKDKT